MKRVTHFARVRPTLDLLEPRLLMSGTAYVVNSIADTVAADGVLTLREAIQAANTDTVVNEAPAGSSTEPDTITFDNSIFASGPTTITLSGTELDITSSMSISGPGVAAALTIDAAGQSRVFFISGDATNATLDGLTLSGGFVQGNGGGIVVASGTVAITGCIVSHSTATSKGGGLYVTRGDVTVTASTISGNSAGRGGGVCNDDGQVNFDGTATLNDCIVSGNTAAFGGGVSVGTGVVTLTTSTISGNHATQDGGGICSSRTLGDSGTVTMIDSFVTSNAAGNRGGGVFVSYGIVTLTDSVIEDNSAAAYGGGVCVTGGAATLTNITVSGNSAVTNAGGLFVDPSFSTVTLNNTIVAVNNAKGQKDLSGPWTGSGDFIGGTPGFLRNPSAGADHIWGTADDDLGDLHLKANGKCVNKGVNALAVDAAGDPLTEDLAGNVRIFGPAVDAGAYEYQTWNVVLASGSSTLSFIDADGTPVTIAYKGLGSASIVRSPSGLGDGTWGDIQTLTVDGSDARSTLTISTRGSNAAGLTDIGQVTVNGPIKSISAAKANLTSQLTVDGAMSALTLCDVLGGRVSIGAPSHRDTTTAVRINLRQAIDASVASYTPIQSLSAVQWVDTDGVGDGIGAPWIGAITITGAGRGPSRVAGDFGAALSISGTNNAGLSLGSFKAAGTITGGRWTIAFDVKSITMGSSAAAWVADFGMEGFWAEVDSITTTAGDLSGQITALSINHIKTHGKVTNATIALNPA